MLRTIYVTIVLAFFAFWFGGFGFYVSVVVPIGTDILGSARNQGVITQQVSDWLNVFGVCAFGVMFLDTIANWRRSNKSANVACTCLLIVFAACQAGLFWLKPMMDAMFDPQNLDITDEVKFYGYHRIYLWLSTFEWFAAWGWLIVFAARRTKSSSQM